MAQRRRAEVRQDHDGSLPIRAWLAFSGDDEPPIAALIDWMFGVATDAREAALGAEPAAMGLPASWRPVIHVAWASTDYRYRGGHATDMQALGSWRERLMQRLPPTAYAALEDVDPEVAWVDRDNFVPPSALLCSYDAWSHRSANVPDQVAEIGIEGPWLQLVSRTLGGSWLVERYLEVARTTRAVTGFIGRLASDAMLTPSEEAADVADPIGEQLHTRVRGAFWGTLVTEAHMAVLGGIEAVRSEAPVHEVLGVERAGGGSGALLRLNDGFVSEPSDQIAALTSFLAPILPSS